MKKEKRPSLSNAMVAAKPMFSSQGFFDINYVGRLIPLLAACIGLLLWATMSPAQLISLSWEAGPLEKATEILWFCLAASIWLLRSRNDRVLVWLAFCIIFIAFGAREMDLHKAWTGTSMLKVGFYLGAASPLHKLVGLSCLLVVAFSGALLLRWLAKPAWKSVRLSTPVGITTSAFVVTMIVSKVLDRSVNVLAEDYGVTFELPTRALIGVLEEILELSLPIVAAAGFIQHRSIRSRMTEVRNQPS